jgi:dihydrofolate synthase/folylpolyglutamate synthase
MRFQTLDQWLKWQEQLHPSTIELGLERVASVWQRLYPHPFPAKVITVAGTNGKGSSVAMLDAILRAAGYRVGAYTSPHLLRYNERIRINGVEAGDERICQAFERIDQSRGDTSLTYFEFGTLAALAIFAAEPLDVVILEVGLGGRLDAVNVIDPDLALITPIDLDHTDWLGHDREQIGLEKAGILRPGRPAVCSDPVPPASLVQRARQLEVPLALLGREFRYTAQGDGWDWQGGEYRLSGLPWPGLQGRFQLQNAAAALQVLDCLGEDLPVGREAIRAGLEGVRLAGRFQVIPGPVEIILDVAHNPAGAQVLADALQQYPCGGRTLAVFSMLADKDVASVAKLMAPLIDGWYLGALEGPRTLPVAELQRCLRSSGITQPVQGLETLAGAYAAARQAAQPGDRLVVFGSFFTVAGLMGLLQQ